MDFYLHQFRHDLDADQRSGDQLECRGFFSRWFEIGSRGGGSKNPEIPVLNGPIYTSTNSGMTWVSNSVPVQYWTSVASSADGCKLVAVNAGMWNIAGGAIWISQTTPVPAVNITTTNSNLMLSWIIPSTNFVLQQNLDLTTTNWETLTDTPALNLTNLQNEAMLSPSNSSGFYRLATP